MRSRSTLHKSKLDEFQGWMEYHQWRKEPVKGDYEVLRMRRDIGEIIIIYDRLDDTLEHYTTFGMGQRMVLTWINESKKTSPIDIASHGL